MIPWWAGMLLFICGILLGAFIMFLDEYDESHGNKRDRK